MMGCWSWGAHEGGFHTMAVGEDLEGSRWAVANKECVMQVPCFQGRHAPLGLVLVGDCPWAWWVWERRCSPTALW